MATNLYVMRHISKLFQEKDSWETAEIIDRLIDKGYRYTPTTSQLQRLLMKEYYNSRKDSKDRDVLALWMEKVQKEKLVEVTE